MTTDVKREKLAINFKADPELINELTNRKWITRRDVAEMLGVTIRTVDRYAKSGLIPAPVHFSPNCVKFDEDAVREAIRSYVEELTNLKNHGA
jgi:predicted DNA-binding transcriptional regulator AlpA